MLNKKQKIASAILGGSLCVALIAGCMSLIPTNNVDDLGTATVIKNGEIQPIMTISEKLEAFTDDALYKITNIYGDVSYAADMAGIVGKKVPSTTLNLLNGEKLSLDTFKNKKYVIEVVADWCSYCQKTSKEYMSDIVSKNTDLEFIQVFGEGNTGAVNKFYEEIGKNPKEMKYVVPADNETIDLINKLKVTGFPTWIFVDETGRVSWVHSGYVTSDEFSTLRDAAYTGEKIYDCLKEDFDESRTGITVDHIYDALDEKAIEEIAGVEGEGQYMVFANLNRKFNAFTAKDTKGNEVDLSTLAGKKVYLEINVADASFTGTVENAKKNAEIQKVADEKGIETVQVWLAYYNNGKESRGDTFREENKLEAVYDYVFDNGEKAMLDSVYSFDIYSAPSQLYINEDGKVVGATTGVMNAERFNAAIDVYYAETPLYKQIAEGAEEVLNTATSSKENNPMNIALIISGGVSALAAVYLIVSKISEKRDEIK